MIATRRRVGALVAGTAAVLAVTLSGCGSSQAGAAAVIGDRRISVADVQNGYTDILPLVGQDAGVTQAQILNLLILQPYLADAAAGLNRGVSEQDARLDISSSGSIASEDLSEAGVQVWQANLANSALQTDRAADQIAATYADIEQELKSQGVHINPRYGNGIDYSTFTITQSRPDWLEAAQPAAEDPTTGQPGAGQPGTDQPGAGEPGTEAPVPDASPAP
ncbi:SurA N-terminal domain-containing protein [Kineosporia babensis]|uniref:SurA N-terminal domain-containing protein n=1 Tax=Kineosporia babensis TaxID=499548 RepID=A0A9X1SXM3_9ACTN|nr:SurA N-terminal domain-containing protein [Kineosporia babensis]MCD5315340.1 SurA N-terminal domain-containing protein [Kineosporia babensis]